MASQRLMDGKMTDFVLKLKIVGETEDASEIRRVRLPRIMGENGEVCYEELVGLAISFVFPENPRDTSDFNVKLTYKDVDDDTVVIGSSEELLDAIDQYSEQRVLRLDVEVKRCEKVRGTTLPQQAMTTAATQTMSRAPTTTSNATSSSSQVRVPGRMDSGGARATSTNSHMLQNVVESVVNIILNAAVAINGQTGTSGADGSSNDKNSSEDNHDANVNESDEVVEAKVASLGEYENEGVQQEDPPARNQPDATEAKKSGDTAKKEPEPVASKPEERQFIHGRHTCDSCLCTPIVGKRYHAVNMSDYDLCEKCYSNYQGSEIVFEAVELERDRHLQTRWRRRHERMNGKSDRRGPRCGPLAGPHKRWGPKSDPAGRPKPPPPPHRGPRGGPHPHRGPRGPPFPPGPPHRRGPHGHPPPPPFHPPHNSLPPPCVPPFQPRKEEDDLALKEALRLSLLEMELKEASKPSLESPKPAVPMEKAADSVEDKVAPVEKVKAGAASVEDVVKVLDQKAAAVEFESAAMDGSRSTHSSMTYESVKTTKKDAPDGTESSKVANEAEVVSVEVTGSSITSEKKLAPDAPETSEKMEVETVADEDDESLGSGHVSVEKPSDHSFASGLSAVLGESPALSKEEPSFHSDAAGSGEAAMALGETLDLCARAIDAMVLELDRSPSMDSKSIRSSSSSFAEVDDGGAVEMSNPDEDEAADDAEEVVAKEEEEVVAEAIDENAGATILDGAVEQESPSGLSKEGSGEDWHVVNEEDQLSGDAELARAAQMIGSALFNSDMRSSGEAISALTQSAIDSAASLASSALTSAPSLSNISSAQRDRWAAQLSQLHELGFDNDERCVEILDRLTAANIGCGNDDEVSVTQVINELWKN